jgi:uncharacterized protein (DUF2267 family)
MTTKTIGSLESSLADTYTWLNEIAYELDDEDRHFALQALRGVLHALRDRLTIDQNAHLSAQLPLLIRGIYFENWDPKPRPDHERTIDGFLEHARPAMTGYPDSALHRAVNAVFRVLERHLSWGEDEKIGKALPHEIALLWKRNAP